MPRYILKRFLCSALVWGASINVKGQKWFEKLNPITENQIKIHNIAHNMFKDNYSSENYSKNKDSVEKMKVIQKYLKENTTTFNEKEKDLLENIFQKLINSDYSQKLLANTVWDTFYVENVSTPIKQTFIYRTDKDRILSRLEKLSKTYQKNHTDPVLKIFNEFFSKEHNSEKESSCNIPNQHALDTSKKRQRTEALPSDPNRLYPSYFTTTTYIIPILTHIIVPMNTVISTPNIIIHPPLQIFQQIIIEPPLQTIVTPSLQESKNF